MILKNVFLLVLSSTVISTAYASVDAKTYAKLNTQAKGKIQNAKINMDALLSNSSNDLIVELEQPESLATLGVPVRERAAAGKSAFKKQYATAKGLTVLRDYNALPITTYRIQNQDTLIQLLNDPQVKAVYPNRINTQTVADVESLPLIRQPQAVAAGFTGEGASVVIADTGLDHTHADFGSCTAVGVPATTCRVIQNFDTAANDNALDGGSSKHGTNVSGVVANTAPKIKLIGIDVFTGTGAYDSDIIAAINWSINNAATYNIKAINLSLGYAGVRYTSECTSSAYRQVFANARAAGVAPVVAAGNDGFSTGVSAPACTPGAVRVGAVYDSNMGRMAWGTCTDTTTAADKPTCFSNGGRLLTLFAPGSQINAAGITQSGTSQAAPHVAALLGALRSPNVTPVLTIDSAISRLQTTGKAVRDTRNNVTTSRVDFFAATSGLTAQ